MTTVPAIAQRACRTAGSGAAYGVQVSDSMTLPSSTFAESRDRRCHRQRGSSSINRKLPPYMALRQECGVSRQYGRHFNGPAAGRFHPFSDFLFTPWQLSTGL